MDRVAALVLLALVPVGSAFAAPSLEPLQPYISESSERFGIPENWVRAVIMAESYGDPKAVSSKGAMGLMQLMPGTWKDMRALYNLGTDPFDPKANIQAGTAYLKAMYDLFGYPALFAAYNIGEAHYEDHLHTGKALPEETSAYVADVERRLGFSTQVSTKIASGRQLFFRLSSVEGTEPKSESPGSANGLFIVGGRE
ncbi:MAG: lytic transglycosylase domain-containing protein [Bdellovibrionales bacterium]